MQTINSIKRRRIFAKYKRQDIQKPLNEMKHHKVNRKAKNV